HALDEQPVCRRGGVGDNKVSARIGGSLRRELQSASADDHLAASADSEWHAREGGGRQPKNVRRHVGGLNDGNMFLRTPARERPHLMEYADMSKARNRKRRAGRRRPNAIEPGAGGPKTCHVDVPSCLVQAPYQL